MLWWFFLLALAGGSELPAWQREILDRRHGSSRASVHRSKYPESPALRSAGRAIALDPVDDREVVIGMTTTPGRIEHIRPTIASLLNQTQPLTIVLNVPRRYNDRRNHWKSKTVQVPDDFPPGVVVHSMDVDYGPATKLIGTATYLRDSFGGSVKGVGGGTTSDGTTTTTTTRDGRRGAVVIAADDDHEWEPFAIATLVNEMTRTDAKAVWSYYTYPFPRERGHAATPRVCVAQAGDLLAAPAEAFLRNTSEFVEWGTHLLKDGLLSSCFFVDDLFFAAYFRHLHYDVYTHPWRFWLFKEVRRRQKDHAAIAPCRGACSPVNIRFRYPDSLAMGKPRDTHNANCLAQLQAQGWWPSSSDGDVCLSG